MSTAGSNKTYLVHIAEKGNGKPNDALQIQIGAPDVPSARKSAMAHAFAYVTDPIIIRVEEVQLDGDNIS